MEDSIEKEEMVEQGKEEIKEVVSVWHPRKDKQRENSREQIAVAELPKAIPSLLSADLGFLDDRPPAKKLKDENNSYIGRREDLAGRSRNNRGHGKNEYYRGGPGGKGRSKNNPREGRDDFPVRERPNTERSNSNTEKESKRNMIEKDVKRDRQNPWTSTQKPEKSNQSLIWQNSDSLEASSRGSFGIWHNSNLDAKKEKTSQSIWHGRKKDLPGNEKQATWSGLDVQQGKEHEMVEASWSDNTSQSFVDTAASAAVEKPKELIMKDWKDPPNVPDVKIGASSSADVREWQNSGVEQNSANAEEPVNVWLRRSAEMQRKNAEDSINSGFQDDGQIKEFNRSSSQHQECSGFGRQDSRDTAGSRRNRDYERRKPDSQSKRHTRDAVSSWTQQRPHKGSQYDNRDGNRWDRSSEPPGSGTDGDFGINKQTHFSRDDLTDFVKHKDDTESGERFQPRNGNRLNEGNYEDKSKPDDSSCNNERKRASEMGSGHQGGNRMRNEFRSSRGMMNRVRREPRSWQGGSDAIQDGDGAWPEGNMDTFSNSERRYRGERNDGERRRHKDARNPSSMYSSRGEPRGRGRGGM